MAKQVIILSIDQGDPGLINVNCAFWIAVPPGSEIPQSTGRSAWSGASTAELTALQNGTVLEKTNSFVFSSAKTKAQIEADLAAAFNSLQTAFTTRPVGQFFGVFLDSATGWSA